MAGPRKESIWNMYKERYNRHGPGVERDAPKKTGAALFFEVFMREWFGLVKLNLLFLLFCLPVLTIPAACTAMSKITVTMIRDQTHFLLSDFWQTFRAEFFRSTIAGGIYFVCAGAFIYSGIFYFSQFGDAGILSYALAAVCAVGLLTVTFAGFYLFPMIASVSLTLAGYLKNSLLLAVICAKNNLVASAAVGMVMLTVSALYPYSVIFVLLLAPALINIITTFCAYHGIRKYIVENIEKNF